jgi:DNA-binding LytR/AlgR family response regulator
MPLMLVYDSVKKEIDHISRCFTDYAAQNLPDDWSFEGFSTGTALQSHVCDTSVIGVFCTECRKDGLDCAADVKKQKREASVVIIADADTSPLVYMKPGIAASGLLLRPLEKVQTQQMLQEIFDEIRVREKESLLGGEVFSVETRDEIIRIPFSKILFFEARDKKIYLCTGAKEYAFYSTLDGLQKQLPEYFIRCHKGFIFNRLLAEKVLFQENAILMPGGFKVPVSRTFKAEIRGIMT